MAYKVVVNKLMPYFKAVLLKVFGAVSLLLALIYLLHQRSNKFRAKVSVAQAGRFLPELVASLVNQIY